jgi:outer membrane protein assembly factor BamB
LRWEAGGKSKPGQKAGELEDCFFLGPPLPLEGRLYVVIEINQSLCLACVDAATGRLHSVQTLTRTQPGLPQDPVRRIRAAHLGYSEGLLVCPTNAGILVAVDLLQNNLVWAYQYREKVETLNPPEDGFTPRFGRNGVLPPGWQFGPDGRLYGPSLLDAHWHFTAPVIHDGLVVFTAPDSGSVHCVRLRDGSRVWAHKRQDEDLFLGGVSGDKVLIVGRKGCRALSLADGQTAWTLETGLPSGQGALARNLYYLPLQESAQRQGPEICVIDLTRGQVFAHDRSPRKEVLGNLIFYRESLFSQAAQEVTAYSRLEPLRK